jgi:hypothetical protein
VPDTESQPIHSIQDFSARFLKRVSDLWVIERLAVTLLASGAAFANEPTAFEKAELAQLSPQLRTQVEARITSGQTVRGILETMLLNNTALDLAANKVVAVDFQTGVEVVEGPNGQIKAFPFDVATLVLKK